MIGLPSERIIRIGDKLGGGSDNFWQMADTGVCGYCTEIFYDHGEHIEGGLPGSDNEGDRFIEIWNLVFMQFDRAVDGTLTPLPAPCVDTGMGLERIAAVLQHVHSNYEIDLFQHLIKAAAGITGTTDLTRKSLRVIADHIRACAFLIADGVLPSNVGRGYVLRKIIRRACLNMQHSDFHRMVSPLVEIMGDDYPVLRNNQESITWVIRQEEVQFKRALEKAKRLIPKLAGSKNALSGKDVFLLYDTHGIPIELTKEIAFQHAFYVDMEGFDNELNSQKERSKPIRCQPSTL